MKPMYNTKLFTEVWEDEASFETDYNAQVSGLKVVKATSLPIIYYLLYGKYGNSPIANTDEKQFKQKVMNVIFMYGPAWEKKLDVQSKLRALTDDELKAGATQFYNHASNPSEAPKANTETELSYLDAQNVTKHKRSLIEGYAMLWSLLENDVTEEFIAKFRYLFNIFVGPQRVYIYGTEEDEDDEI